MKCLFALDFRHRGCMFFCTFFCLLLVSFSVSFMHVSLIPSCFFSVFSFWQPVFRILTVLWTLEIHADKFGDLLKKGYGEAWTPVCTCTSWPCLCVHMDMCALKGGTSVNLYGGVWLCRRVRESCNLSSCVWMCGRMCMGMCMGAGCVWFNWGLRGWVRWQ